MPSEASVRRVAAQQFGDEAVLVHRDVHDARLIGGEAAQGADVRRTFRDDDVAGIAVDAGDEIERHLGADGDDDVVGIGADSLGGHHLADLLTQLRGALCGSVLQGDLPVAGDEIGDLDGEGLERQRGEVGHAAGERDHLGSTGHREEGPDLRCGHSCRACREPLCCRDHGCVVGSDGGRARL